MASPNSKKAFTGAEYTKLVDEYRRHFNPTSAPGFLPVVKIYFKKSYN